MVRSVQLLVLAAPLLALANPFTQQLDRRVPPTCTITTVDPPPQGYVCGGEGRVDDPAPIKKGTAPSQEKCRDRCLNSNTKCISFSYGPGKSCVLYSKRILGSMFHRDNTNRRFWNRRCYKKTCVCSEGLSKCSGDCVDKQTDESNCGTCGNACGEGASCTTGACTCPAGQDLCSGPNGPCQDIQSDNNNCGSCGNKCGDGATCSSGACTCPAGQDLCSGPNGPCQDIQSDNNNCGSCGNKCGDGATCSSGVCTCPAGQGLCNGPNGPCSDTYSDSNNCGTCGNVCAGSVCYHGVCPDCSGDFCSQGAGTPCNNGGGCNCVGIDGSQQYGRCTTVDDGTSCEAFSPRCATTADCPSDKFCGNYQVACNCARNACFPKNTTCSNNSSPSRLFKAPPKATGKQRSAKGGR